MPLSQLRGGLLRPGSDKGMPVGRFWELTMHIGMTTVVACSPRWNLTGQRSGAERSSLGVWEARLLNCAHEWLMGRRTFALAERLANTEHWPPEKLRALQLGKLQRLADHAVRHCPFYAGRGLPPSQTLRGLTDLGVFSLLTRDDLRCAAPRMCWQGMPGRRLIDHSRGTTEERLAYYWDRRRQAWDKANRLRAQGWHGFTVSDRELHLWPVDPPQTPLAAMKQWVRSQRDRLLGELQIDCLQAFRDRLALTWRDWRRFNPTRVTAYPSALARLIREGRQAGCRVGNPALRKVFLTGEVVFDWQRRLIETELGVPTAEMYGVQEVGAIAFTCEYGAWHIAAESVIIEYVRNGRPARPGELAEVVATSLESLAMPMIRYCTGDIVRVDSRRQPGGGDASGRCSCGRGLPVMPPLLGRAGDFLATEDGRWIEPRTVIARLGEALEDGTFQVEQDREGSIEIRVTPSARLRNGWSHAARTVLHETVGPAVRCEVREVSALQRSPFGKCRYIRSQRTRGGLAVAPDR